MVAEGQEGVVSGGDPLPPPHGEALVGEGADSEVEVVYGDPTPPLATEMARFVMSPCDGSPDLCPVCQGNDEDDDEDSALWVTLPCQHRYHVTWVN